MANVELPVYSVHPNFFGECNAESKKALTRVEVRRDTTGHYYGNEGFKDLTGDTWDGFMLLTMGSYTMDVWGDERLGTPELLDSFYEGEEEGLVDYVTSQGNYIAKFVAHGTSQSDYIEGYIIVTKEGVSFHGDTVENAAELLAQNFENWRCGEIYDVTVYEGERYFSEKDPEKTKVIYEEVEQISGNFGYDSRENLVQNYLIDLDDIVIEDV